MRVVSEWAPVWSAVILGIVEGVTEFVPVSSTGHLILAGHWLAHADEKAAVLQVFIQLGAVLAVAWFYRRKLIEVAAAAPRDPRGRAFIAKLALGFLPAALVGLLLYRWILRVLFGPLPVAVGLALGGALLIALDRERNRTAVFQSIDEVTWTQALLIGCVQVAALWPGVSRSGATIIGGLLVGLSRAAALEFSFFLAIPTLSAASLFAVWEGRGRLVAADLPVFAVALAVAFAVSLLAIATLLRYVRDHNLRPFGWYRLALAAAIVASGLGR